MPEGFLLGRDHLTDLRAVVRDYKSRDRGRRPLRRRAPVFQPVSSGLIVYQCVVGMRLYSATDFKSAVLAIAVGEVQSSAINLFGTQDMEELRREAIASTAITPKGIIVQENLKAMNSIPSIAFKIEQHLGKKTSIVMLDTSYSEGYFGTGSVVVGNSTRVLYGIGSQVFRASASTTDTGFSNYYYGTLSPTGFSSDVIVVRDLGGNYSTDDYAYVTYPRGGAFDRVAPEVENWLETSAGWFPVFEIITAPMGSGTPNLSGVSASFGAAGATISFTTDDGTKSALVPAGLVLSGQTYLLVWTDDDHYEVANPELAVTGNCDAFITDLDGSGNFTVSANTVSAQITRGLCLDGKDYGLVWADSANWSVIDPEMECIGIPTAHEVTGNTATFTVYAGTKGSESSTGETVDGLVRHGVVFTGHRYKVVWVDLGWEVADPTISVTVQCDALAQAASSATMSVYYGTPGSESDTTKNVSAYLHRGIVFGSKKYRCSYVDNGWVVDNPALTVRGKVGSDVAAAASGTLDIYTGTFGSESQPSGSPTVSSVRNDSSCAVKANQIATAIWVDDNGGWEFIVGKTS